MSYGAGGPGLGDDVTQTEYAGELHDLALSINEAMQANDADAVQGLWAQFQTVASNYQAANGGDLTVLNLINTMSANVQAFLTAVGSAVGTATADVAGGLLSGLGGYSVLILGGLGLWLAWPFLVQRRRKARAA
jgi:hypothetical protein